MYETKCVYETNRKSRADSNLFDCAQVRLESSKSHLQPSSTASGIMSSRTKLEQDSGVEVSDEWLVVA